jgi:C-terminal processing protease CtpA/Prc
MSMMNMPRPLSRLVFVSLTLAILFPTSTHSQHNASPSGRWQLTIEDDARRIEMPVDLRLEPGGAARLVLLGKTEGEEGLFTGAFAGDRLLVKGRLAGGEAEIALGFNGERAMGRASGDLLQAEIYGTRAPVAAPEVPVNRYEALLGAVLSGVEQYFYDPKFNGLDLKSLRARHLPRVKAARNDSELAVTIRQMLAELRSSRTEFFLSPDKAGKDKAQSAKPRTVLKNEPLLWRQVEPGIGYLAILNFAQEDLRNFDGLINLAMSELVKHPSLIVDLRGNRGERLEAALAALNLLLPEGRPVAYVASREAKARLKVDSIDRIDPATLPSAHADDQSATAKFQGAGMYLAGGKFKTPYRGRMALLIDEHCAGACELFAAAMKEAGAATLIGRRTRGALMLSAPVNFTIIGWAGFPRNQVRGWQIELPTTEVRTANRLKIEGRGVDPDIAVERRANEDADLARALEWFAQHKRDN